MTNQKDEKEEPQNRHFLRYLMFLMAVFLFIRFFFNDNDWGNRVLINYSEFKNQVLKGNIERVVFSGNIIKGVFSEKVTENNQEYKYFKTIKPSIEDQNLMNLLESRQVSVAAEEEGSPVLFLLLLNFLPWAILIGYLIYAGKKMQNQMDGKGGGTIFSAPKDRFKKVIKPSVTYSDVAGLENVKLNLREVVEYLKNPNKFLQLGASVPKGILLLGPPGCGKTLLARATAGEAKIPFFHVSGSEFIEVFVGVGASRVRKLFEEAKKNAPSIIFIDEVDGIGRTRGAGIGGGHDEREQTLNQILSEMDGFEPHESVVVMAATNRPDVLDPALIRPGRFDRQFVLELPHKEARKKILLIHTKNVPIGKNVNLDKIADMTVGFSGADLKNLVNEGALLAGRESKSAVDHVDFENARDKIMLGLEREEKIMEYEKTMIAYHESGHALIAKLLPDTDPIQKVTIIPRGMSLGVTEQVPKMDRHNYTQKFLSNMICIRLGGRVAERMIFNDMSSGAAHDLKMVTQLAQKMICQWGMSEHLGPVNYNLGEEQAFLGKEILQNRNFSEDTAKLIDEEVRRFLREMEERVEELLQKNRKALDKLAQTLLKKETLENKEIEEILRNEQVFLQEV